MKLKKILASLTAAALAVTTVAVVPTVSAADDEPVFASVSTWSGDLSLFEGLSSDRYSDIANAVFNVTYTSCDEWSNGKIHTNSNGTNGSDGWSEAAFGTGAQSNVLAQGVAADVDVPVVGVTDWLQLGIDEYGGGVLKINSITLEDSSGTEIASTDVDFVINARSYSGGNADFSDWSSLEDPSAIKTVRFNMLYTSCSQWSNGKVYTNSNGTNGSDGWSEVSYGTGGQTNVLSEGVAADIDVPVVGVTDWLQFGFEEYGGGNVTINSIKLLDASGNVLLELPKPVVSATSIILDTEELPFKLGDEAKTVTATVEPANTTDTVEWSIDNETVASIEVSADGLTCTVTPLAVGETTLIATANEDATATCTITVEENTYPITVAVNNKAYGTASANKTEAAEGETVKLKATPNTGYKFVEWKSDEVTVANNAFTMPAEAVTVTAVFAEKEADEFDIVVTENNSGSVVVEGGLTAAKAGDEINLIVTPDEGYELDTLTVNGEAIDGTSFTMPAEDVTIEATFKKATYNVDIIVSEGGDADVDKTTAQMGDTVNIINIKPDDGFVLDTIAIGTENNVAIRINEIDSTKYSFIMPACDVVVSVSFKEEGSAGINVDAPDGVDVGFTDDIEDILAAIFGEDYEDLIEQGYKLDVIMTVKGEDEVSDDDKALIKEALADGQQIGLILDITLIKTINGVSEVVTEAKSPVSFSIGVPDSIIADGRTYSVIRVHNDGAQNISGTFNSETKAITVSSALFSTYAIVYEDEEIEEPVDPEPKPVPVKYYSITSDSHAVASADTARAGTVISVRVDFGYDAYAYCGSRLIMKLGDKDTFVMPAGNVRIVSQSNGYLAMIRNAAPNSYIFVYDSDMNHIKTNGSVKGIVGEGKVTVKLGEEYAGRTITLYKGRKSTKVKIAEMVLDENGNATFTVEGGKNYTAVVE